MKLVLKAFTTFFAVVALCGCGANFDPIVSESPEAETDRDILINISDAAAQFVRNGDGLAITFTVESATGLNTAAGSVFYFACSGAAASMTFANISAASSTFRAGIRSGTAALQPPFVVQTNNSICTADGLCCVAPSTDTAHCTAASASGCLSQDLQQGGNTVTVATPNGATSVSLFRVSYMGISSDVVATNFSNTVAPSEVAARDISLVQTITRDESGDLGGHFGRLNIFYDLDGDGDEDLVTATNSSIMSFIKGSDGQLSLPYRTRITFDALVAGQDGYGSPIKILMDDFNGDGNVDLAMRMYVSVATIWSDMLFFFLNPFTAAGEVTAPDVTIRNTSGVMSFGNYFSYDSTYVYISTNDGATVSGIVRVPFSSFISSSGYYDVDAGGALNYNISTFACDGARSFKVIGSYIVAVSCIDRDGDQRTWTVGSYTSDLTLVNTYAGNYSNGGAGTRIDVDSSGSNFFVREYVIGNAPQVQSFSLSSAGAISLVSTFTGSGVGIGTNMAFGALGGTPVMLIGDVRDGASDTTLLVDENGGYFASSSLPIGSGVADAFGTKIAVSTDGYLNIASTNDDIAGTLYEYR